MSEHDPITVFIRSAGDVCVLDAREVLAAPLALSQTKDPQTTEYNSVGTIYDIANEGQLLHVLLGARVDTLTVCGLRDGLKIDMEHLIAQKVAVVAPCDERIHVGGATNKALTIAAHEANEIIIGGTHRVVDLCMTANNKTHIIGDIQAVLLSTESAEAGTRDCNQVDIRGAKNVELTIGAKDRFDGIITMDGDKLVGVMATPQEIVIRRSAQNPVHDIHDKGDGTVMVLAGSSILKIIDPTRSRKITADVIVPQTALTRA